MSADDEAGLFRVEAVTLDLRAHRLDSLVLMHFFVTFLRHHNFRNATCSKSRCFAHDNASFKLVMVATACTLVRAAAE